MAENSWDQLKSTDEGVSKFVDLFNVEEDNGAAVDVIDKKEVLKLVAGKHVTMTQVKEIALSNDVIRNFYENIQTKDCWKEFVAEIQAQGYPNINDMLSNTTFLHYFLVHQRRGNPYDKKATLASDRIRSVPLSDWKILPWFEVAKLFTMVTLANTIAWPADPASSFRKYVIAYSGIDSFMIVVNIMEAVMRDFELGFYHNAMAGVFLCLTMPVWNLYDVNEDDVVIGRANSDWAHAYLSWNATFLVYGLQDMPYKPISFAKLLSSQIELQEQHGPSTFLATRGLTLITFLAQYFTLKQLDAKTSDEARAKRRKALRAQFQQPSAELERLLNSPAVKEIVAEWGKENYRCSKRLVLGSINYLSLVMMLFVAVAVYFFAVRSSSSCVNK